MLVLQTRPPIAMTVSLVSPVPVTVMLAAEPEALCGETLVMTGEKAAKRNCRVSAGGSRLVGGAARKGEDSVHLIHFRVFRSEFLR